MRDVKFGDVRRRGGGKRAGEMGKERLECLRMK